MYIFSAQFGHSTSSSSTHSIIWIQGNETVEDSPPTDNQYDWDHFVLSSNKSKTEYLAYQLYLNLSQSIGNPLAQIAVENFLGIKLDPDGYIDHQSVLSFPVDRNRKHINLNFFNAVMDFIQRNNVVILGGNDNEPFHYNYVDHLNFIDVSQPFRFTTFGKTFARYDSQYKFWTLYNYETGDRIRFSFEKPDSIPSMSTFPEIVDVKITNKCFFNCDFCYQNSHIHGLQASVDRIHDFVNLMKSMGVFEVAIGGGEPTIHPYCNTLIHLLYTYGITPNISTRNVEWILSENTIELIKKYVGGIAFSVNTYNIKDFYYLMHKIKHMNCCFDDYFLDKMSIHIVDGLISYDTLCNVMDVLHDVGIHKMTILGFKDTGRGRNYPVKDKGAWKKIIEKYTKYHFIVSVDTLIAHEYNDFLKDKLNVDERFYLTEEGLYSMYIDLTQDKPIIGKSSYNIDSFRSIDSLQNIEQVTNTYEIIRFL